MLSVVNAIRVQPRRLPSSSAIRHPAADPCAAPILGPENPGDVEKPEFRSAVEPADDLAGLRFADKYGKRAKVVVSSLAHIMGAETIADYRCVGGSKLIGHGDVTSALGLPLGIFASSFNYDGGCSLPDGGRS